MRLPPLRAFLPLMLLAGCSDPSPERTFSVALHGPQPVVALAFSHAGDRLYLAGARNLAYGLEGAPLGRALDVALSQLALTQTHVYALAAPGGPTDLRLYTPQGACLSCTEQTRIPGVVTQVVASADGGTVVALTQGSEEQPAQVFRVNPGLTGAAARGPVLREGAVRGLTLSPDGSLLLVTTPGGDVEAVDSATGQQRWRYEGTYGTAQPPVGYLYWSAGEAPLAGLSVQPPLQPLGQLSPGSGALAVLDEAQRGLQLSHDAPPLVRTRDGRFLFGREEGSAPGSPLVVGAVSRYDLETRTFTPLLDRGAFNALALSPDGETLAVGRGTEIDLYSVRQLLEAGPLHR